MSVRFHLPNFVDRFNGSMNMTLISMIKRMPRMFYDGVEIASVFDCFPMIWNGGRIMAGYMDMQTVDKLVPQYLGRFNSLGVPCRLTLTNPLLTREHLNDPVCNRVLDIADNGMNEAIVFSPLLEEHIRKRHPNMKIISSTCKQIRDLPTLESELEKDYSLVVLDYNYNNDFDTLAKIPHKDKCRSLHTQLSEKRGALLLYRQISAGALRSCGAGEDTGGNCKDRGVAVSAYEKQRIYPQKFAASCVTPGDIYQICANGI